MAACWILPRALVGALSASVVAASAASAQLEECPGKVCEAADAGESASLLQARVSLHSHAQDEAVTAMAATPVGEIAADAGGGKFVKYFSYTGSLNVSGWVSVQTVRGRTAATTGQLLSYQMTGVDGMCNRGPGTEAMSSCAIQIHKGTSCEEDVGPHYYNDSAVDKDPWPCVGYTAVEVAGVPVAGAWGVFVKTGVAAESVPGRVVVLHGFGGEKVACAVLASGHDETEEKDEVPVPEGAPADGVDEPVDGKGGDVSPLHTGKFVRYVGYEGSLNVSGGVTVLPKLDYSKAARGVYLSYRLKGLDPECRSGPSGAPDSSPNSCGIHIHNGTSCEADAGPHFYNKSEVARDPWHCATYTSTSFEGEEIAEEALMQVNLGMCFGQVAGRTIVVHDKTGARIACAVLE